MLMILYEDSSLPVDLGVVQTRLRFVPVGNEQIRR